MTCRVPAAVLALLCALGRPDVLPAQRADNARAPAPAPAPAPGTPRDSLRVAPAPPLTPRRAFLYSLALPGYAQSRLARPTAGALFVLTESIALAMLRESAADLREARRFRTDSTIFLGTDPITGERVTRRSPYSDNLIDVRRGHVEDWLAFLLANHLFAAADAYVAANLWDLPSQISVRGGPHGPVVSARFRW